jgi:hypothetical protein
VEENMILFLLEKGNLKNGFKSIQIVDANDMFQIVYDVMKASSLTSKIIRQWQQAEYTYIDYGSHTDFFRYKAVDMNTKEKEAD